MSRSRAITPHVVSFPLLCSEFRRGRDYANWRPRGSGDWLLISTVAGAGEILAGGQTLTLRAGGAALFRPDAVQDYATEKNAGFWHLRWAHFLPKAHWHPWLLWPEIARGTGWLQLDPAEAGDRFAAALERMLVASRLGGTGALDLAMNALEEALIWAHRSVAGDRLTHIDARVRTAIDYFARHPAHPFSLDQLARLCGLSVSRLSHLFQRELQTTPRRFAEKLRLDYAQELLAQTDLSVGEIAAETGFEDPLYFSRRFKSFSGRSPVAYRRRVNQPPESA